MANKDNNTMQTGTAEAPDYKIETPAKDKSQPFYVFTVADQIDPLVKDKVPGWYGGGLLRTGFQTLRHVHGYLRRFQIVPMRESFSSEKASNYHPDKQEGLVGAYSVVEHGVKRDYGVIKSVDPVTRQRTGEPEPDGLLRVRHYPVDEKDRLTGQNDGIVLMPVKTDAEMERAQLFLFPNWPDIEAGVVAVPTSLAEIEAYFKKRLEAANGDPFFTAVADAAIQSCVSYRIYGNGQIRTWTARWKEADTKGWPWSFGPTTIMLFEQLGVPRPDMVQQQSANDMGQITNALAKLAEVTVAKSETGGGVQINDPAQYARFLAFQEFERSQAQNGTPVPVPAPAPPVAEDDAAIVEAAEAEAVED